MGRQHLAVGVDVDTLVLSLLQELLQIVQIVAGDYDKRPLLHHQWNGGRDRLSVGLGICLVEHLHAGEIHFSDFENDGQKLIHTPVLADGKKRLHKELVHSFVGITEHSGMISVGRHAANTEKDHGFQTANILVGVPDLCHVVIIVLAA